MQNKMLDPLDRDRTCKLCNGRRVVKVQGQEYPCVCQKTKLVTKVVQVPIK